MGIKNGERDRSSKNQDQEGNSMEIELKNC